MDSSTRNLSLAAGGLLLAVGGYSYIKATRPFVLSAEGSEFAGLVRRCKAVEQGYWPSLLSLWSPLELIPFMLFNSRGCKAANRLPHVIEEVEMEDGEVLQIVWWKNEALAGRGVPSYCDKTSTPIVMLHHGAMCNAFDLPGQGYVKAALERGWIVCALNRRGHTKRPLKVPKFQFFGSTSDVRAIVEFIRRTKRPAAPVYFVGLSSGSGLVAKYMGEQGVGLIDASSPSFVNGAVGVCPGYNIEKCMARMQWPYQSLLLQHAKEYFLERNHALLKDLPGYACMAGAKCFQSWLDASYGAAGYRSKDEFYLKTNPMETAQFIREPMLIINSANDPVCVEQNVTENLDLFRHSQGATLVLTRFGGHLPFLEASWNPLRWDSWAERLAVEYIEQVELWREEEDEACRLRAENMARMAAAGQLQQQQEDNNYSSPGFAKALSRGGTPGSSTPQRSGPSSPGFAKSPVASGGSAVRSLGASLQSEAEGFLNVDSLEQLGASSGSGLSPSKAFASPVSVRSSNPASPWSTVKSPGPR